MSNVIEKIVHAFKRHPLLYLVRYMILSKNGKGKNIEAMGCFNDSNTLDSIPKLYFEVNAKIPIDRNQDEIYQAIAIGAYLRDVVRGGPGIGLSSEKTLRMMLEGDGGVCSDFSQIFNVFCFINGIRVREWGIVDCLYKTNFGHSFNEIYSNKLQKWVAIDIHKGIVFEDVANRSYFSVIDLFKDLRNGNLLKAKHYADYMPPKPERIPMVYSGNTIPFLVHNKPNAVTDHYYNKFEHAAPILLINALLILLRKNQTFIFVLDNYKMKLLPKSLQIKALS